ncbi:hypothetical protein QN355_02920 [Cryobacterium sp. 10S3]|uniref:hypothetical protein n=1 Tax=Cryobacterium sp. 10S3 TaxID=3048582 RepID=UPI002AC8BFCA|nr:hypothetical protein [Cryobacterium sp. 10S3]MEB0285499.1 hypothetical protein [Cryobacterium sp. 10S3]WPX15524.1 hypothetical protein RHM57_09310 [Cryobacterium sp. 10S3]
MVDVIEGAGVTELAARGWTAVELAALAGANVLRVLRVTDVAFAAAGNGTPLLVS